MNRVLFRGARILDPASGRDARGDLLVEGEQITAIGGDLSLARDAESVDAEGLCLAPGLVDMRVQLREPGAEHLESIESGGRAAAAGGVTTMVALPNTEPAVDDVSVVEFLARRAREVRLAKVHTYAAATKGLAGCHLTEMGLLAANGALGFTDGVKAVADALVMRRVLSYARSFDLLVLQHPEEPSLGGAGEVNEGEVATRLGLAGITPAAEIIMVERDLRLVEITGARYHAAHVSTAAAIEAIRQAKALGLPVTCDTAPPTSCSTRRRSATTGRSPSSPPRCAANGTAGR
jgi:dihydroorotase